MSEPTWITREVIMATQVKLLERFGGLEGVRDEGLLESAMYRPRQLFNYGNPTIFDMAAAYTMGLVKNHPFLDGNKRIGFMAAYIFLGANGYALQAPEEDAVLRTLALAAGVMGEDEYAAWLEKSCEKAE